MARGDGPALFCAVLAVLLSLFLMTAPVGCEASRTPPTLVPLDPECFPRAGDGQCTGGTDPVVAPDGP